MTTHTPGPWTVEECVWLQGDTLYGDDEYPDNDKGADYLVKVGTNNEYVALAWGDDNARLIAQAPAMLALVRSIIASATDCPAVIECDARAILCAVEG
jgi:hypothetical protein